MAHDKETGFNILTDFDIELFVEIEKEALLREMIDTIVLDTINYTKIPIAQRNLIKQRSNNPIAASGYLTELASMGIRRAEVINAFYKLFPVAGYIQQPNSLEIRVDSPSFIRIALEDYLIFVIRTQNMYMDHSLDYEDLLPQHLLIKSRSNLTRAQIIQNYLKIPKAVILNKAATRDRTKNIVVREKQGAVGVEYTVKASWELT